MDLALSGKTVCITGSSRGIGRAIAETFLQEGARVVLTGRDEAAVRQALSELTNRWGADGVIAFCGDLTREEEIARCLQQAETRWGGLDIAVANLGLGRGTKGWNVSEREWMEALSINLIAASLFATHAVPLLRTRGGGSLTFIGSLAGVESLPAPIPYASAKSGLLALSKMLAKELAADGIRVNTVAPGNIRCTSGVWDRKVQEDPEGVAQYLEAQVAMKRLGRPEEIADAVAFLSSPRASFITGACLLVDGGQSKAW
ncbi:MAG: SDR family oxidoreductase [Nitrospiraceae bacterium]|nr:SDR family oxidoreductase [Nitrospiraceae bacterium]